MLLSEIPLLERTDNLGYTGYYDCGVDKEELLSREECYKLVRDPKYKDVLIAREKFDFLECGVEQISLF